MHIHMGGGEREREREGGREGGRERKRENEVKKLSVFGRK